MPRLSSRVSACRWPLYPLTSIAPRRRAQASARAYARERQVVSDLPIPRRQRVAVEPPSSSVGACPWTLNYCMGPPRLLAEGPHPSPKPLAVPLPAGRVALALALAHSLGRRARLGCFHSGCRPPRNPTQTWRCSTCRSITTPILSSIRSMRATRTSRPASVPGSH